tara:strand:- start:109 stop:663 length:555 start_codon:yes stop_codon:yes gene_type:complete
MKSKKLTNHFLIATQSLNDTIFKESIILLCDHSEKGSMGLILNKPMIEDQNQAILMNTIFDNQEFNDKIYFGGPVDLNTCFILHDSKYLTKETLKVSKEISLTSNEKIIDDLNQGIGPNSYRLNIGYAGWSSGQLEQEIKNGDWLFMPAQADIIFNVPDNEMWKHSNKCLGLDINQIYGTAGKA